VCKIWWGLPLRISTRRREENIKIDLNEVRSEGVDCIYLAQVSASIKKTLTYEAMLETTGKSVFHYSESPSVLTGKSFQKVQFWNWSVRVACCSQGSEVCRVMIWKRLDPYHESHQYSPFSKFLKCLLWLFYWIIHKIYCFVCSVVSIALKYPTHVK
jgi:hypothetical protein